MQTVRHVGVPIRAREVNRRDHRNLAATRDELKNRIKGESVWSQKEYVQMECHLCRTTKTHAP